MRREGFGVALMVAGVFGFYAWSGRYWIDVVDEGYFLDLANRVLHGALPYRDFATYYTPGVFYLFAFVFQLFGTNILAIRVLMAALRAVGALLLYGLTRRVAPWWLAWAPFGIVAALDHWPIEPEPHPSWPAMICCLVTLDLVARHLVTGERRWLALAGAAAGLAFAFKQNVRAFTALGLAGYVLLRPRGSEQPVRRRGSEGHGRRWLRVAFAVGIGLVVTAFLWPGMDISVALALWLPVLVALGIVVHSGPPCRVPLIGEVGATGGGFVAVTAVWLVPLLVALGPGGTPFGLFLGLSVDQNALAIPFAPPWPDSRPALTTDPTLGPWLAALDGAFGTWHLYLPALAAWLGVTALLRARHELLGWYLLFGTLAALNMYPRADTLHALVSSPPLLVVGASALAVLCGSRKFAVVTVRSKIWRGVVVGARVGLVALVVAALAPQVLWRYTTLFTAGPYAPLGPMLVPEVVARDTRGVVELVQAGTQPGAALFVYPAAPLLNVLAERPNPTRFDHYLPGTLSADDLALAIEQLEQARPRYVVWDHRGVVVWQTDPANRLLSDYLWRCYREVAAFGFYLVLERDADAC